MISDHFLVVLTFVGPLSWYIKPVSRYSFDCASFFFVISVVGICFSAVIPASGVLFMKVIRSMERLVCSYWWTMLDLSI
jgi:hypothetical protein